nr:polysaccharide lyase [Psychroflexus lacisalsi]
MYDSINYIKFLSFSFKVPNNLKFDEENLGRETMICQWHSKPAPGKGWRAYKKYMKYNRPSVALYLTTNNNQDYYLLLRYGNNGKSQFEKKDYKWSTITVQKIEIDKWHDMMFEIKWSFTNAGYIAVWMNNEPFTPFNGMDNRAYGPNMHNESPAYFKFGQYRYWDDSNDQEVYFDELRVGNSFEEVSIYENLPKMFQEIKELYFIKNHK